MDKVKATINWLRHNPLTTVCLLVVLLSIVSLYYPTYSLGASLRADMAARRGELTRVRDLLNKPVEVPASDPSLPPVKASITVTDSSIRRLQGVYQELDSQYHQIFDDAVMVNRYGHEPLVPLLFPYPSDEGKLYDARNAYQKAFRDLHRDLHAGSPPTNDEVQLLLDTEEEAFRRRLLLPAGTALSDDQEAELRRLQAARFTELVQEHAGKFHIFAAKVELSRDAWVPGPFEIHEMARPGRPPEMGEIWEAQMRLWVQQDIVLAIRKANHVVDDPQTSLVQQPVKRLLSIRVDPNYVGEPVGGRVIGGVLSPNQVQQIIGKIQTAVSSRIPGNFEASPTGRVSGPLYDVRHATVKLITDSRRLPEVLNALSTTNFMTVIGVSITDVDEYAHLRDGYFYGFGVDAVEATIRVESLWLRRWTAGHLSEEVAAKAGEEFNAGLMPDAVRHQLGLPVRDRNFQPPVSRSVRTN